MKRRTTVGLLGYTVTDPRVRRIKKAGVDRILWVVRWNETEKAQRCIVRQVPKVVVVNPRHAHRFCDVLAGIPPNVLVVQKAQPFGEKAIDAVALG